MSTPTRVALWAASAGVLLVISGFAASPSQKQAQTLVADFIVTAAPAYDPLAALKGQERFPRGAHLLLVHNGKVEPLVPDFAASADGNVSFDAKRVLFTGKKSSGAPWQIWELTLADHALRQVTKTASDAIRPLYLPAWRIVYAQRTPHGFQLESARIDDSPAWSELEPAGRPAVFPLSFANVSAIPSDVLADGRILFESGFPLGSGTTPELFMVYSDGSGVEAYRCDHGPARWAGKQLASGDVVFTHGSWLARFTSPLSHEERIHAPQAQYAGDLAETASGAWLLSARTVASGHYTIRFWNPGAATMMTVLAQSGEDLVQPVLLGPRPRPHRHPSALHPWDYANLLALDARLSRDRSPKGMPVSVRMETEDVTGRVIETGTAPVESDGSFFVQVPGDKPIRFALLDAKGAVLCQEHGWFWARGGEQRYCVGCHAGPERAPENRVPAALLRTTTPVDLTGNEQTKAAQAAAAGGR